MIDDLEGGIKGTLPGEEEEEGAEAKKPSQTNPKAAGGDDEGDSDGDNDD